MYDERFDDDVRQKTMQSRIILKDRKRVFSQICVPKTFRFWR